MMKHKVLGLLAALMVSYSAVAQAQLFPLFGPANGVLKGNAASPQTTAAASTDIVSLFSACSGVQYLGADGACHSVLSTPVSATNGGTGEAGTITGIAKANSSSAFTAATSPDVTTLWSGTCNSSTYLRGDGQCQSPGGSAGGANPSATIGLSAVNGVASTFMTSDSAPALSQAITPTWTNVHTFTGNAGGGQLKFGASGAYSAPSANIGLFNFDTSGEVLTIAARTTSGSSTVNINASNSGTDQNVASFSRSGSGFTLSSGTTFNMTNAVATYNANGAIGGDLLITGNVNSSLGAQITNSNGGTATSAQLNFFNGSHAGLISLLGTANSSGEKLLINSSAGATLEFQVNATPQCQIKLSATPSSPSIQCLGPSNATMTDMSPDTGSFTATFATGCGTTPTATFVWSRNGKQVILFMGAVSCTSTTTGFTITGLPSQLQPARTQAVATLCEDNTILGVACAAQVTNSGTITMLKTGIAAGWTSSGTKGINPGMTISWLLN